MNSDCDEQKQPIAEVDQPIEHTRYSRRMLVHRLSLEGYNSVQIAARTGFSQATVWRDLQDLGRAEQEILEEQDATSRAVQRVITTLDSAAAMKKSIDVLDGMIELYTSKLLKPDGKIDGGVHKLILEAKAERQKWVQMHEQAQGRIIPAPTLIQQNNVLNETTTNQTLMVAQTELDAMRARYNEAKQANETMKLMGEAEAEGARLHDEGVLEAEVVRPSHPDVLP